MQLIPRYFENHVAHPASAVHESDCARGVYKPEPWRGGLGQDALIGHGCGPACDVIDLSAFEGGLTLNVLGKGCGEISDGIDAIVFRGVETIILPAVMHDAIAPNLQAYRDQEVHVCLAGDACAPHRGIPAE